MAAGGDGVYSTLHTELQYLPINLLAGGVSIDFAVYCI